MTKEWFSTIEIAELLGVGDRRIRDRAKQEGWQKQKRHGLGGGFEYHLNSLPIEARQKLARQESEKLINSPSAMVRAGAAVAHLQVPAASQTTKAKSIQQFINLPEKAQKRADAKLVIVNAKAKFCMPYIEVRQLVEGEKHFAKPTTLRRLSYPNGYSRPFKRFLLSLFAAGRKRSKQKGLVRLLANMSLNGKACLMITPM